MCTSFAIIPQRTLNVIRMCFKVYYTVWKYLRNKCSKGEKTRIWEDNKEILVVD